MNPNTTAVGTQATKLELLTKDFLKKSQEVEKMAAELKQYIDDETEKLIGNMKSQKPNNGRTCNFSGSIIEWTITYFWSGSGQYVAKICTCGDSLVGVAPEIVKQWHSLCELKLAMYKYL